MTTVEQKCPVCLNADRFEIVPLGTKEDSVHVSCRRCGRYKVDSLCLADPKLLDGDRHLLSGFLRHENINGNPRYYVRSNVYSEIKGKTADDFDGKCLAILDFLFKESGGSNREVKLHPTTEYPVGYCFDGREFVHLVNELRESKLLEIVHCGTEAEGWGLRLKTRGIDIASGKRNFGEDNMAQSKNVNNFTINGPVGALQSGVGSVAHVIQNVSGNKEDLLKILAEIRDTAQKKLPTEKSSQIVTLVDDTREELALPDPNRRKLSERLSALGNIIQTTDSLVNLYGPLMTLLKSLGNI